MMIIMNVEEKIKKICSDNDLCIKGYYYDGFSHGIEIRGESKAICKLMEEVSKVEEIKKIYFTRFENFIRLKIEY